MTKPKITTIESIDFIDVLEYLEKKRIGIKDRVWGHYQDRFRNDSFFRADLTYGMNESFTWENEEELKKDFKAMRDLIERNRIVFWVSW